MSSLIKNIYVLKNSNKIAVIMCDNENILQTKTFQEIIHTSEIFEKTFRISLGNNVNLCIGLCIEKNIHLPSVIICLQKLEHAFVYLYKKDLDNAENCNVDYILSLNIDIISNFEKHSEITVDKDSTFKLWKNSSTSKCSYLFKDIFCIVKTSGTTGENKTIRIPYTCIENNAVSLGKVFKIDSTDVIFWGTPLSFDPSLIELLLALLHGATLLIVPYRTYINPTALFLSLFKVVPITILQMVPSVFLRWDENSIEKILCESNLKILAFGGEVFPKNVLKFKRKQNLFLFNLYGITELSCWATVHQISEESPEDEIPIGQCLNETIVEVLDKNKEAIKNGEGVIYIGSNSRKCFIDNETEICLPIFRETGDIGYIENSNIYYKGRKNKNIKRYGHKINLTKIEETIFNKCNVSSKCVWSTKRKKLLFFILIKHCSIGMKVKIIDKIRAKLLHILPQEYYPDYFEILQSFPTTLHGKIDEKKLEEFYIMSLSTTNLDVTELFCNLWYKYLGISSDNIECVDNYSFFELGGKSINILQLISEFKELTNIESAELLAAIFEKKLSECKTLLVNCNFKKAIQKKDNIIDIESVAKRQKIDDVRMRIIWKYDLKACVDGQPLVFTEKSNTIRIAAGSFCNIFTILNENGEEIFQDVLTGSIETIPTISSCKHFIYIGCYDGTMHCIDYHKKLTVWKFKTGDRIKSSAFFLRDRIVFGSYDKHLYCLFAQDGSIVWKTEVDGNISANVMHHEKFGIFVTTTSGCCYCLSETNGNVTWVYRSEIPIFGTPCITHQLVIVPSVFGILFCLSAHNGELIWKFKSDGHIFSSIVNYKDFIIFGCHDKNVYVLRISAAEFILAGKILLNSEISSTPFVYEQNNSVRILAVANVGIVYSIDFQNLTVIQELKLPGESFSSPFVYENKVYVGCRDNNLYCLSLE